MIPIATTRITVLRKQSSSNVNHDPMGDGFADEPTWAVGNEYLIYKSGVRAEVAISTSNSVNDNEAQLSEFVMICDPTTIKITDRILDETTNSSYDVVYVYNISNFAGLGHTEVGMSMNSNGVVI